MFRRHSQARFDLLFPNVDIFLKLARQKFAHLGIQPVHVGGQGKNREQQQNQNELQDGHGRPARFLPALVRTVRATLLRFIFPDEVGGATVRAINVAGSRKRRRSWSSRSGHFSGIGFVVISGEMQQTVQH